MLLKTSLQVLPLPRASSDQIFTTAQTGKRKKWRKKGSAILHRVFAVSSAIYRPFYLKYVCLCVHLLAGSSITGLCAKPKAQAVAFSALRHNQNVDDVEEDEKVALPCNLKTTLTPT